MAELLQQLLTETATRTPEAIAIESERHSLSYDELERLSNRLARALRAGGVERGDRVGILARKSAASVVAAFACLKCGACYVPLDPESPAQRLELIVGDSGIGVLLCDELTIARAEQLAEAGPTAARVVVVAPLGHSVEVSEPRPDQARPGGRTIPWDAVLAEPSEPVTVAGALDTDLAYILYTSGSTGVPKGVMISHRASLTFVRWAAACAGLTENDRVCSPAPLHFDLSVFDVFASCRAGATMVLVPPRISMFPVRLAEWIQERRVSVWYSVPSVLTMLASHGNLGAVDLSGLRVVIFAGEVFPARHLSLLMRHLPAARHLNWYGPTETNVCTWYEVPAWASEIAAPVPIGTACAEVEAFAVTAEGRRVETVDERGELYVAGPGLMSGYWGQPERTAEVLVPNPLEEASDMPVYRTGDMVTLDAEGNYVFLGRRDGMVKTRGYRVEVGEVESALYEHPAVREAVVVPVPDELLGNRLRAVVCADPELTREGVLAHCRRRLPAYMVPDTVEFSERLPKTSTGKIDRMLLRSG